MTLEKVYDELISMIEDLRSGQRLADSAIADLQKETQGAQRSTGNPIVIDAAPVNAEALTVTLMPYQTGSGDPSPTNIRPITGYTECEVDDAGKNLFDETNYYDLYTNYEYTENSYRCKKIQLKANTTYTITQRATVTSNIVLLLNNDIHVNGTGYFDCRKAGDSKTYTTGEDGYLYIGTLGNDADTNARLKECKIQIEEGSQPTTYEPYHSSNATIQFGQTVYGGTVDFNTGLVTITDANIESYDGEALPGAWISDRDVYAPDATPTTGAQVVYKLATPTTLQLTPAKLKMIKRINYVSTNGTTISLTYQPDNVLGQILAVSEADDAATLNAAKAYADSVVTITPALESGTKLADYTISGTAGIIYGPSEQQATRKATVKKSTKEE